MPISDFIVLNKIGLGSYSQVFKVKRISDHTIYALKKVRINNLKKKQKQNALNQVRLLASINSEHIISYKETFFDQKNNTLCIIMEYADGGDLQKLIEGRKRSLQFIPERSIWSIIRQLVTGLNVLHDLKIIHRDLKSANIFLSGKNFKIADLNVSKLLKSKMAYTQTGTPYYASPEVWQDKPYEFKSDIWSLGCIIYELCALKSPFTANNMNILYKKVLKGSYPRIPGLYSQSLEDLIKHCLQVDVNKRVSCRDLLKMLSQKDVQLSDNNNEISLLSTIKVPRSLQSWRQDLPKSNYRQSGGSSLVERYPINNRNCYITANRNKLLQIAHVKQQQQIVKKKDNSTNNPEQNKQSKLQSKIKQQKIEMLPRIKLKSQPNDKSLGILLSRIRSNDRRAESYKIPQWWG